MARADRPRPGVDDVVLIPISPSRRRRARLLAVLAALAGALLSLVVGFWLGHADGKDGTQLNEDLHVQLADTRNTLRESRHDLAVYKAETQVGKEARDKLRERLRTLHDQMGELEEAVAFYKNVMSPADDGEPLQVQNFELKPAEGARRYRYRLVLVQAGDNRGYLSGGVSFQLTGERDGKPVALDAGDLLSDNSDLRFRFRYFQQLTGTLTVPEGVKPASLGVVARSTGRRRSEVEKRVSW